MITCRERWGMVIVVVTFTEHDTLLAMIITRTKSYPNNYRRKEEDPFDVFFEDSKILQIFLWISET